MAQKIPRGELIITNLDAWAAWYQGLTTMWFPVKPDFLGTYDQSLKAKYIVITNYLEDDGDFALGEWQEVVYTPHAIKNQFLQDNYFVLDTFIIAPEEVYENRQYQGTILLKKM